MIQWLSIPSLNCIQFSEVLQLYKIFLDFRCTQEGTDKYFDDFQRDRKRHNHMNFLIYKGFRIFRSYTFCREGNLHHDNIQRMECYHVGLESIQYVGCLDIQEHMSRLLDVFVINIEH